MRVRLPHVRALICVPKHLHLQHCVLPSVPMHSLHSSHTVACIDRFLGRVCHRYQGVDWRDGATWGCNGVRSPAGNHYYDGVELDAYEVGCVCVRVCLGLSKRRIGVIWTRVS